MTARFFPRHAGQSKDPYVVLKASAHRLLDRLKAGCHYPPERIEWALKMTGDAV